MEPDFSSGTKKTVLSEWKAEMLSCAFIAASGHVGARAPSAAHQYHHLSCGREILEPTSPLLRLGFHLQGNAAAPSFEWLDHLWLSPLADSGSHP